jgi:RNA polymerase sigma factor (sigma-70 family)
VAVYRAGAVLEGKGMNGRNPNRPPGGTLYATHTWDGEARRWRSRLNAAGEAEFQRVLALFGGKPIKIIATMRRRVMRAAAAHRDQDGVHQAAMVGLLLGILRYREGRGAGVLTCVGISVLAEVRDFLWPRADESGRRQLELSAVRPDGAVPGDGQVNWDGVEDRKADDPADAAERADQWDRLANALDGLKPAERRVLVEYHVSGRTAAEIGKRLGATAAQVRQTKKRATEVLSLAVGRGRM